MDPTGTSMSHGGGAVYLPPPSPASGAGPGWGQEPFVVHPQGKSTRCAGHGEGYGIQHSPRRPRPQRLTAGEHSREAGAGPAPQGRERGLLWKRFCIRIKS